MTTNCRPLEPPLWTGLILDTNLTDWHKELWRGEKVKMMMTGEGVRDAASKKIIAALM